MNSTNSKNSPTPKTRTSRWAGVVLLVVVAALYLWTLDNGLRPDELIGGDLITHQYAQVEARPSNAPGYPLYTMGGWLWFHAGQTLLRWALNPTQILSAYSMLWGLASLAVLYLILLKITKGWWPAAALLTAFHATTFFFWYYSVTTEQYSSAVFQTLLLVWLALRWDERPSDATLLWLAFICGTMLANMVTTLFILPPLLWFIFSRPTPGGRMLGQYLRRPGLVLKAIGAALLPILSYAYVYIRGAQHPEWRGSGSWPSTWAWFVDFMTIQQGRDELAPGLDLQTIFTDEFPQLMWQEMTVPVFVGGLLGLWFLGRRRAIFFYSTLLIYLLFCWGYRFGNWFQVIIPAYPIFTIGLAALLVRLKQWSQHRPQKRQFWRRRPALILLLLAGLAVYSLAANVGRANQRNRPGDTGLDPGWAILVDPVASPALVAADFSERVALQYLVTVWDVAPEIRPIDPGSLPDYLDRPNLYTTRQGAAAVPALFDRPGLHPQAAGVRLIGLNTAPQTSLPVSVTAVALDFGPDLQLLGWEWLAGGIEPPPPVEARLQRPNWRVVLYWRSTAPLAEDYTVSVRPLRHGKPVRAGEALLIQDHQPVWGLYPTSRWTPGEIVPDVYALPLPPQIEPEAFTVLVYRTTTAGFETIAAHTLATGG